MPFRPGQSGNPAGRGVGEKLFRDALMLALKEADGDRLRLRIVADKLVENAMRGETAAIREIADRIDGKVPTPAANQDDVKLIVEIRSFPPLPDSPDPAARQPTPTIIEHRQSPSPDAEIVELPPFLGNPKPQK